MNLTEYMKEAVLDKVEHYQSDVTVDFRLIKKFFKEKTTEFVWILRKNGTCLISDKSLKEKKPVECGELTFFLKDNYDPDSIRGEYVIYVSEIIDDKIFGYINSIEKDILLKRYDCL